MIHTSTTLPFTAYTPRTQNTRMDGYRIGYGTRSRFTKRPTSGRLRISRTTLPTYMEAMKLQNSSGWFLMSSGPGETPWTIIAASMTAGMGPEGTPSASIGTNAPDVAALFADSGPATPATAPWPNSSGRFESFRSRAYDTKLEMMWAEPGMIPITNPSTVPRPIGPALSFHSRRDGSSSPSFGLMTSGGRPRPPGAPGSGPPQRPAPAGAAP